MNEIITIFTPTYNREHLLYRCYESLCHQNKFNFKWLIVDDGSSDQTGTICKKWRLEESRFKIDYIYKENGGLHTAYNTALQVVDTEVFCCLESDDFFTSDATTIIENEYNKIRDSDCVGFISLCKDIQGNLIGDNYPAELKTCYFYNHRKFAKGDKQYVYKTEMLKKVFPQKVFDGEKFFDPKYSFFLLDEYGPLAITNTVFDISDYQDGGLTDTVIRHYYNSPNSFIEYRKLYMTRPDVSKKYVFRQCIHYVSSCCLAHKLRFVISESPRKVYTLLSLPFGIVLSFYIRFRNK